MAVSMRQNRIRIGYGLLAILLVLTSGCSGSGPRLREVPASIKIACCDQRTFDSQYLDFMQTVYPNTRFDLIPLNDPVYYQDGSDQALKRTLEEANPDLVILNPRMYRSAADQGLLSNLEQYAKRHGFDLAPLSASMLDVARNNQDGKLFGLCPIFRAFAVFYNKSLFQRYGVTLPDREMSWDELLQLASRFANPTDLEIGTIGLHVIGIQQPYDLMNLIALTEGLQVYDRSTDRLLFDSDGWRKLIFDIVAVYRNGTFPSISGDNNLQDGVVTKEDMERSDLFGQGRAAMAIAGSETLSRYEQQKLPFEWGLLPGPVQTRDRGKGGFIQVDTLFGIPNNSAHSEEAWRIIASLMSEVTGKVYTALDSGLSVYEQAVGWRQNPDYEAFYKLRPELMPVDPLSTTVRTQIATLVNQAIVNAINGDTTVEDAIAAMQDKGKMLFLGGQVQSIH